MTTRTILCGACGTDVPYGRLSCPACGELLASVAGGVRRSAAGAASPSSASDLGVRVAPAVLHDALLPDDGRDEAGPVHPAIAEGEPEPAPSAAFLAPSDAAAAVQSWPPAPIAPAEPRATLPGSYVPPSMLTASAMGPIGSTMTMSAGLPAPARAWAGHLQDAAPPIDLARSGETAESSDPAEASGRLAEFLGWLTVAGGALSAVGFLLPWGPSMIGATGTDYLDRWGLAGPFHLVVALGVVVVLLAAIVPNPVPAWIRIGIAGTALGSLIVGLAWPYVFGFSTTGPGALAVLAGAAMLVAAGLTALGTERHAGKAPPV